jgi:mannitol/fructose-specific phosphotransferase system IIA component (Ntr-type)
MRHLHLKALAAIAHIVQHPEFEKRWTTAKNEDQLKDILLLSERIRMPVS